MIKVLVSFKIGNFLSFNKEQSFSMIPSLPNDYSQKLFKIMGVPILKMGLILGANSSGKSNLLKAINVGILLIKGESLENYKNYFSKHSSVNQETPTLFEFTFYTANVFYTYGFTVNLYKMKYLTEYLYILDPITDNEKVVFERSTIDSIGIPLFISKVETTKNNRVKFNSFIKKFNNSSDELFLYKVNNEQNLLKSFSKLKNPYSYFNNNINLLFQNRNNIILDIPVRMYKDKILNILNLFDTGIADFVFQKIELPQIKLETPGIYSDLLDVVNRILPNKKSSFCYKTLNYLYVFEKEDDIFHLYKLSFKHHNTDFAFDFFEESDGIKRLFELIEIIINPKKNNVYLIDELNRSIHPVLTVKFIEYFKQKNKNFPAQLIFTSHESTILKKELFRRDEIWFVEKDNTNSSILYSLDIFKPFENIELLTAYLNGNYGAIPLFRGLDNGDS